MTFGSKLKIARVKKNMTQKYIAEELNIRQQAISQYENDKAIPSFDAVDKISMILDVPINYFSKNNNGIINNTDLSKDELYLLEIYKLLPDDKKYISIELLKVLKNSIKIEKEDGGNDKQLL